MHVFPLLVVAAVAAAAESQAPPVNACIKCHEDLPGKLGQAVADWRGSVHAHNEVFCDGCHGSKDALPGQCRRQEPLPHHRIGIRRVPYFCGQCHVVFKEKHLGSPHGENGLPNCTFCHSNHSVQPASLAIINEESCTKCHPFTMPKRMSELLTNADAALTAARGDIQQLDAIQYDTTNLGALLDETARNRTQINLAFHGYDLGKMTSFASDLEALTSRLQRTRKVLLQRHQIRRFQEYLCIAACVFLFIFSRFLIYYHRVALPHTAESLLGDSPASASAAQPQGEE